MTWGWQQLYDACLREKEPSRLPERLVIAEKAIVQRLQELAGPADDLPEGRALREALNRLYALYPHEHHPPGQIQDDETDPTRRNWTRLVVPVALGLTLASATAWMAERRNDLNDARRTAVATELQALRNSRTTISWEQGLAKNRTDGQGTGAQSQNPNVSPEAPAARRGSFAATSTTKARDTIAKASDDVAYAPEAQVENAPSRDSAAEDSQSTSFPATEPKEKSDRPRGTVSVSASTYPSIRVPPELRWGATSSAESLQIGQSISRTDPIYPEEAGRQHIEGTVKLRAIVGKDGAMENVEVVSGPPLLASAAVATVRQWRYKPTLLGDQPIQIAEDVTIVFRLADGQTGP